MGKKRRILIAALLLIILSGFGWWLLRPREPYYKGQPLSRWLGAYNPEVTADLSGTDEAVRHIGTNAFPTLLRMLRASDSPLKARLIHLNDRQNWVDVQIISAEDKNFEGAAAFRMLGADARNAVPGLIKIYEDKVSDASKCATAYALGGIGPAAQEAIPALLQGLKANSDDVRLMSISSLGEIHSKPESVVPELTKILHDQGTRRGRLDAAYVLGEFGTNARPAIPELIEMLKDQNKHIRELATNVMRKIDPEAAAKAGVK
jgi:hypothetical protein